jgi:signal peptidase II
MDESTAKPEPASKQLDSAPSGHSEHTDDPDSPILSGKSGPGPVLPPSRFILFFSLAVTGGIADLLSKSFIFRWRGLPGQKDIWWVIDGYLGIETAVNIGAVFGLGAGKGTIFAAFSIVAAIGICIWLFWFKAAASLWLTTALGLVSGGIIGNLYDRLGLWWVDEQGYFIEWQSGVRDWILFQIPGIPFLDPWPNFNIADSLLVVGAGMLLYQSFFPGNITETKEELGSTKEQREIHPASKSGGETD